MLIYLTILAELILVAFLILGFYRLKPRFGLVPLFVLIGSNQFFQTILATSFLIKIAPGIIISPGATILFGATLFTVLLVYIKEGVFVTQRLIVGIILANLSFTILAWITNQQFIAMKGIDLPAPGSSSLFKTNSRVFVVGTIVLLLDALLIVILYEYFFIKQRWLTLFSRLLLTMLLVLNIDAVIFTIGSFGDKPGLGNRLLSQFIGKSIAAFCFAGILWIYLRYLEKKTSVGNNESYGKEDIFSILTYRSKYQRLVEEKAITEEQLQKAIAEKTAVLQQEIVGRMQAEELMKHEKQLSDSLINSLPGVFYLYNEEGKFIRWNKNFETVTGYSEKEMSERHPLDFFDSSEKQLLENKIKNVFVSGEDQVAADFVDKYGNKTPYFFTGKLISYEGKKCLMGVGIDISERIKAEEALTKSEESFRTLVEQASDGIFISNPSFQYILVNNSACRMLGYKKEELLQKSIIDITYLDDSSPALRINELKEGRSVIQERLLKHKDGSLVPVEISGTRMYNGNLLAFVRDISERKKYQQTMERSERNLRQVLTSITDIFYVIDRNYQITLMNKTAGELLTKGWSTPVLIGKNVLEMIPAGSTEPVRESFEKVFKGESVEYEHYHSSKEIQGWFLVNYHPVVSDEGNITGAYVVTRDITERKKAQQQVISYNQQLRDLTAHLLSVREEERRRIGREIHDDLGQQLTAIKMDVAWIDKKIQDDAAPVKGKLKNIITLLDGSNQSVRRILNELKPSILDEYGLLDALEWHAKQFTENTGIEVVINSSETEIKLAEDLATCIFRVYQESLTNVARHSGAKKIIISLEIIGDSINVTIEDDGNGFDVSSVLDKGTFGLLGMKERVRALNGNLEIKSVVGVGTTIIIHLPLRTAIKPEL